MVNACIKNEKRFQVDNPILYLMEQEMEQTKPKSRRRKQIIKIRVEASKMESRKKQNINETEPFILKRSAKVTNPELD